MTIEIDQNHLQKKPKTAGNVESLFKHIPQSWWTQGIFEETFLQTDGHVYDNPEVTEVECAELLQDADICQALSQEGRTLDLCSGHGRHVLNLAAKFPSHHFYGHDQCQYLITLAQERCTVRNATFTVGDSATVPYDDSYFDFIMIMGNSFGYSSDNDDLQVLRECFRVLKPNGILHIDLTNGDYVRTNFNKRSWEWMDQTTFLCRERELSQDQSRLASRRMVVDTQQGVLKDEFYDVRLYNATEMAHILEKAQFVVKTVGSATSGEMNERNRDIGLMTQRLVVKARRAQINGSA